MVFLSVTDSADIGVEPWTNSSEPVEQMNSNEEMKLPSRKGQDSKLAEQLHLEAIQSQLVQDAHLAEQLQLKENSYMTPRYRRLVQEGLGKATGCSWGRVGWYALVLLQ